MEEYYLGIDIGGTKCAVILGDENRRILDKISLKTDTGIPPEMMMGRILDAADGILGKHPGRTLRSAGISCGGPLNSREGVILSPPNLPGWDEVPVVDIVKRRLNVDVYLQNDANACALAEWRFGAGRGSENMIFLTFGTGLGAGLILNGRLYAGKQDTAGEVGHVRLEETGPVGFGKAGSFEGFCSGGGIAQMALARCRELHSEGKSAPWCPDSEERESPSAKDVAVWARKGEPEAVGIYEKSGRYLGRGLSILIDLLNPEKIIIGSIFSRDRNLLYPTAVEVIRKEALEFAREACEILPAGLGDEIGDIASLAVAVDGYESRLEKEG